MVAEKQKKSPVLNGVAGKLLLGTALAGLAMMVPFGANAQNEIVTVTGTSIRGAAPVGANVITVDRVAIEESAAQTTQQLLTSIPQVSLGFGSSGQTIEGGGGAISGPTIHSLGSQGSNATLVLINGHRIPSVGQTTSVVDPSIIPTSALQRVEVLADGASAIYGADAIAGVLNFITRKDYNGWETSLQYGIADHYNSFNISQLFGHGWGTGSVNASYNYSNLSNLMNGYRDFSTPRQDIRLGVADPSLFPNIPASPPAGALISTPSAVGTGSAFANMPIPYPSAGSNFQNFSCPIAAISTNSTGNAFLYPYTPAANVYTVANGSGGTTTQNGISRSINAPSQGVCDTTNASSALAASVRNSAIVTITQNLNDWLSADLDLVYSSNVTSSHSSRGTLSATAFSPFVGTGGPAFGSNQANPFYVTVPGATGSQRNSEFISYNFDQLLGPGAGSKNNTTSAVATMGLAGDLGSDWLADLSVSFGQSVTGSRSSGGVAGAQALLALNGTTNSNGTANSSPVTSALTDTYGLGTVVSVTRALTTANALDVWNPAGSNRTSASVLRSLVDSSSSSAFTVGLQDASIKFDGPLGNLFGTGVVKAAFGGEFRHDIQNRISSANNSTGPSSTSSRGTVQTGVARTSYSGFAEITIPLVNRDMGIPLAQSITLDASGRYDHFSDFGQTKNPKIGFDWVITDGLKARGSYGTSFVPLELSFVAFQDTLSNGGVANNTTYLFNTTKDYSNSTAFEGAGIANTWVASGAGCAAAGSTPVDANGNAVAAGLAVGCKVNTTNSTGLSIGGVRKNLNPETGMAFSAGLDVDAGALWDVLRGFGFSVTFFNTKFQGVHTNQGTEANVPSTSAFGPDAAHSSDGLPGWAQSDPMIQNLIAVANLNAPLPARVYTIRDGRVMNAYTLWENGLDFDAHYRLATDDFGDFNLGVSGSQVLRFSQRGGFTGPVINIIDGNNQGRFTAIELQGRASLGWRMNPFAASLSVSYSHPYSANNTSFPYSSATLPDRIANFQHVAALVTADLNVSYDLPADIISGTSASVSVRNLFGANPPFVDTTSGMDVGNQIGRQITFGLRKKF